jgi:hypothetical protein
MLHHERSVTDLGRSVFTRPLTLPAKYFADKETGHGTEGISVTSQQKSQFERYAQYPLANGHIGDHMVHEMRCAVAHAPCGARTADAAFFAGKCDQNGAATLLADGPQESIL